MPNIIFTFEDGSQALAHHGIKGMKWGVRRYQNADGSLTAAGRGRYSDTNPSWGAAKRSAKRLNELDKERAVLVGRRNTMETGIHNTEKAIKKATKKGNTKKVERLQARNEKYNKELKEYNDRRELIQKEYNMLGKGIVENGYELRIKSTTRSTLSKGEKAANAALVVLQSLTPSPVVYYANPRTYGQEFKAQKQRKAYRSKAITYANRSDFE